MSQWLEHYGQRFATVEINNSFYRLPPASTFEGWAQKVPDDFVFAVKASRYLTHVRRLRAPEEPVMRLVERMAGLGSKLGPVLLQLPPNLPVEVDALDSTLRAFPRRIRVAVEFRHDSWWTKETRAVLERYDAAWCLADPPLANLPTWRTADWGYLRFHRGRGKPTPCYGRTALNNWAERLTDLFPPTAETYVYFNNDTHGCAVRDARRFAAAAVRSGAAPTRTATGRDAALSVASAAPAQ
jgi:uncharacterized protein YecE (DUF72 family)